MSELDTYIQLLKAERDALKEAFAPQPCGHPWAVADSDENGNTCLWCADKEEQSQRIAELEAAHRPVRFSERTPAHAQDVLAFTNGMWQSFTYYEDDDPTYPPSHWLPMPPAPEAA